MNFVSYRNRRQDLYVHIISWCGLLQNSIFVPGAVQFCRSCWIYLTNHCRDKCLSLEDAMEESHFSPIFPEKMTFKPLSPCAFYKHDSCFPLASDKQGLMCPCRETILVGDESPQSLLEHALHCISQCCSAEVGVTAGWQGKDECSCHLTAAPQTLLLGTAQEVLWPFQPSSCQLCSACSQLGSIHPDGRNCRTDWETLISPLSWGRPW